VKGVIFNIFEEFVVEKWDEGTYEEILARCRFITREPFVGPGTYPDQDLLTLIASAVGELGVDQAELLRSFGRYLFHALAEKVPATMLDFAHPKDFLKSVEDIIHIEVKKLYRDAQPPRFTYLDPTPDRLTIEYRSPRRMYDLMDGLIEGVGERFNSPIQYERTVHRSGDEEYCEYRLIFSSTD